MRRVYVFHYMRTNVFLHENKSYKCALNLRYLGKYLKHLFYVYSCSLRIICIRKIQCLPGLTYSFLKPRATGSVREKSG